MTFAVMRRVYTPHNYARPLHASLSGFLSAFSVDSTVRVRTSSSDSCVILLCAIFANSHGACRVPACE